jgi:glycosyltransferase involved in cell wall biosynthesis
MTDAPKVSVLMGVRDGGDYLRQAVDSVLAQTLGDLELIVVDDGSSDDTPAVLASYDDSRLVLLRNERNLGLTPSLNVALAAARGRYVARQDADDRSLPTRLERQVAFLDARTDISLCGSWARLVDGEGRLRARGRPPSEPHEIARGLLVENKIFHGTVLARRELMEELGGYREAFRYSQDYDLCLRAVEHHRLANLPEELYELRFHDAALTSTRVEFQFRFRVLARELARQRRANGRDELERGIPVDDLLERAGTQVGGAEYWRHRAMYRRLSGDLPGYRKALLKAIRHAPGTASPYAQLMLSLGGRRSLELADRVFSVVRRPTGAGADQPW